LVFSKHLFDSHAALRSAIAFATFCALSGAVYAFNDVRDKNTDRHHPLKRHRPVAAGSLKETTAMKTACALAVAALALAFVLSSWTAAVAAIYLANNVAYSLFVKKIPFADVLSITVGFLLRVIGGAYAISVPVSWWLLACTALLASLLGFGKRAHELAQLSHDSEKTRPSLTGYTLPALRWLLGLLALATTITYAIYTLDSKTAAFFGTHALIWTTPFCLFGIARFLQLAMLHPRLASPTDAILRDAPFLVNMALWGAVVLFVIY